MQRRISPHRCIHRNPLCSAAYRHTDVDSDDEQSLYERRYAQDSRTATSLTVAPETVTGVVTPNHFTVGAGGAVVALSDVEDEYQEMVLKAWAVLQAVGLSVAAEGASLNEGTSLKRLV